jgi:glycosyltransferase involved in cell wall biosynthesis
VLLLLPWLSLGGADAWNMQIAQGLGANGWEVSIATTLDSSDAWASRFARATPDIFMLHRFLDLRDYPRFLRYLIQSRDVDVVINSHSEIGYRLLPYLRAHAPQTAFVDYCHIEEAGWGNGGYPRFGVEYQSLLDSNIVSSDHLAAWMKSRCDAPDRVTVVRTNVDADEWRPDPALRKRVRDGLGVPESTTVILYAARICEQKQPLVFADVMAGLADAGEDVVALVAGDGPDLHRLRRRFHRSAAKGAVRFLGAVEPERMQGLYNAADIHLYNHSMP